MRPESHSSCGSTAGKAAYGGKEFFSDPPSVLETLEKQMRTLSHPHYLYQIPVFDPAVKVEPVAFRSLLAIIEINFIIATSKYFYYYCGTLVSFECRYAETM